MTSFYKKMLVLSWKSQILRRRSATITALELTLPIAMFLLQSGIYHNFLIGHDQNLTKYLRIVRSINMPMTEAIGSTGAEWWFYLLKGLDIVYAPANNFTDSLLDNVVEYLKDLVPYSKITQEAKHTEHELVQWLKNKTSSRYFEYRENTAEMGIMFTEINSTNDHYKIEIRTTDPNMITNQEEDGDMSLIVYVQSAFLGVQLILEKLLLVSVGVETNKPWLFGYLPSIENELVEITSILYMFLVFAYLFLVVSVIRDVVVEKENGTKELMKIMGVDSWLIWFQWFVYTMMVQLPVIVAATFILTAWQPAVINAGVLIVFLLFLLFTINITVMLFAVSCIFYKAERALNYCLLGWFILNSLVLKLINNPVDISIFLELAVSLFPVANLCWSLSLLFSFHSYGVKWTWSHLFSKGFIKCKLSIGDSILAFIASTFVATCILIYMDAIFPGPYGVPKPLTFICQWVKERFLSSKTYEYLEIDIDLPDNFEPVNKNAKVGIIIRGLKKSYGFFRKKVAVEMVNLDIYQGEIMALLGHNGAGKTTTMYMITGMTAPSKGAILFEGQNITVNKKVFKENLGFCPQHNLYFSKLTVIEHLMFFGMLKGMSYSKTKTNSKNLLFSLNMLDKATIRGSKLSGGMKRKLCLAVSLIGNPKVLILDEPTSGLDPETRRTVWDIILKMRGERTVLISTHNMEEADVLGDRIAIMDHGRVVCSGTSLFLKKLFGAGYHIHVLKTAEAPIEEITNVFKQNIPQLQVNTISDVQVDYIIKEEFLERFPALFSSLERQSSNLNITGVTVTCSSMEDVFLKVADISIGGSMKPAKNVQPLWTAMNINEFERLNGIPLFLQQIKALFNGRVITCKRQILPLLITTSFVLFFSIFLVVQTRIVRNINKQQHKLVLNLNLYPEAIVLMAYDRDFENIGGIAKKVAYSLKGKVKIFPNISFLDDFLQTESNSDSLNYARKYLFALTFSGNKISVRYHNNRNVHAPAIAINFLANILLLNKTNGSGMMQVINYPYKNTDEVGVCDKAKTSPLQLETLIVYPYLFTFTIALIEFGLGNYLGFITKERITGFKHQLFLAGASPPVYWLVNLVFDFSIYFVETLLLLLVLLVLGPKTVSNWIGILFLVYFLQGWSLISLTYLYTFLNDSPESSLALYSALMIFLGVIPAFVISTGLLQYFVSFPLFVLVVHLLSLNPVVATILCTRYILRAIVFEEACIVCSDKKCPKDAEVFRLPTEEDYSGILSYLYILIITSILYPIILMLVDGGMVKNVLLLFFSKEPDFSTPPDVDEDVKLETLRVEELKHEKHNIPLRVESLEKKYAFGPKVVDKVSFLVMKGDCFGLLGVNGAGKSTTFKMLAAEILPDRGDAFVYSLSVKKDRLSYMFSAGYCPQGDAFLPSLTGEEILSIIGRIRGIPAVNVRSAVTLWLDVMGISEHGQKRSGNYSGGTKRKLNTAMALIGSPEVVFLDEPTSGVDPASRRKLWTVVKEMQKQGQAVVLTSHSMEECEALCTRLTIMVGGKMKCIGNVEYLKTRFGKGFTVLVKLNEHSEQELELLKEDFNRVFPANAIKDENEILIHYTVLDPKMLLSQLFTEMLQFKRDHPIVADFTASNTTLEELFLSLAADRKPQKRVAK